MVARTTARVGMQGVGLEDETPRSKDRNGANEVSE